MKPSNVSLPNVKIEDVCSIWYWTGLQYDEGLSIFITICALYVGLLVWSIVTSVHETLMLLCVIGTTVTVAHEVVLFVGLMQFIKKLIRDGASVFHRFSMLRSIASFVFVLANSIYFLQICTEGKAYNVPDDVVNTHTISSRLNFYVTCVYGAAVVLTGTGNTSILPITWYSRLLMLPHLAFSFLINVAVFGAFLKKAKELTDNKPLEYRNVSSYYSRNYNSRV